MSKNKNIRGLFTNDELIAKLVRFEWLILFEQKRKVICNETIELYKNQQLVMELALGESDEGLGLLDEWVSGGRVVPKDEPKMIQPKKVKIKRSNDFATGYFHGNDYY